MTTIFSLLNSLGFWPDKGDDGAAVSGFNDAMHAAHAAVADVLASDDKRMRIKSAAAYEYLGVRTEVLSSAELPGKLMLGASS